MVGTKGTMVIAVLVAAAVALGALFTSVFVGPEGQYHKSLKEANRNFSLLSTGGFSAREHAQILVDFSSQDGQEYLYKKASDGLPWERKTADRLLQSLRRNYLHHKGPNTAKSGDQNPGEEVHEKSGDSVQLFNGDAPENPDAQAGETEADGESE